MLDFHAGRQTYISLAKISSFREGEMALGDICWDPLPREWTWQILPEYRLSRFNPG
jgi:hypothetical protein